MKFILNRTDKVAGADTGAERLICTGMITDPQALKELRPDFKPDYMALEFARWTAEACVKFYDTHGSAPGRAIEEELRLAIKGGLPEATAGLVAQFLDSLSTEYERGDKLNSSYTIERGRTYFRERSARLLIRDAGAALDSGQMEEAEQLISTWREGVGADSGAVNPFTDPDLIWRSFHNADTPLFTLPGAAGDFLNPTLVRGNFLSILAPEKRGKTFLLMELGKLAARARCNVAVFGAGDMTEEEMTLRWHINLAGRSNRKKYCGAGWVPCMDCGLNQRGECDRKQRVSKERLSDELLASKDPHPDDSPKDYRPCTACQGEEWYEPAAWWQWREAVEPLCWEEGLEQGKRFMTRLKGRDFKLKCVPTDRLTVPAIRSQLQRWEEYEGFVADVVIIDYMDILDAHTHKDEFRHGENGKWKAARALAMERHLLLITATQADAASYTTERLGMSNFSEDKRKLSHATGIWALNQNANDKRRGIIRWGWVVLRNDGFDVEDEVCVVQCLAQGRPLLGSFKKSWRK